MIILRCKNESGVTQDLDLFQEDELTLDISAIESGELGEVFGISSQAFALPGTHKNNLFFGNLFDLGITPATGFTKTIPCQVLYNGDEVFTGKLYIENVITNQQGDTIYNVVVVNEVVDFKFQIEDLTMQDLDWSSYNHSLTMTNITGSWTNNLFSGSIVYPLINYGVNPNDPFSPSVSAGGGNKEFDNSSYPLRDVDFRPTIKAKDVIDKIFDKVDYSYTSSFFDSEYFDKLYVVSTQGDEGNPFVNPTTSSLEARVSSIQNLTNNTPAYIDFPTEIYDNSNAWVTNEYTAPISGSYTFYAQLYLQGISGTRPTSAEYLKLEWFDPVSTQVLATTTIDITGAAGFLGAQVYIGPTILQLNPGNKVRLLATVQTSAVYSATYPIKGGKILVDGPKTYTGGNVNMSKIWEDNLPVLDFLTGIINKFNLVFEPIVGERNVIRIEPFNDWVDLGTTVDWVDKVDRSVKWEITHPLQSQPRLLHFTDVEDTDALNKYTKDKFNKIYGEYKYTSDSDVASGERKIGSFFAPTPIKGIDGAPTMLVPTLAQFQPGEVYSSPYSYKPRLLYNVGLVSGSYALQGYNTSNSTKNPGNYWVQNDAGIPISQSHYPLFHHLELDVVGGVVQDADFTTRDLHFGNILSPGHWSYHQNQVNAKTKRDSFYEYWSFYVNELYDVDSRKVTLNVKLKPSEIQDIRLNDKIHIDGHYYRIDKISGADLTKESSVQVTLIKTAPRKLRYPRRRILNSIGTLEADLQLSDAQLSANGTGVYVDFESGQVVSGSITTIASNKDGLISYDGGNTLVWNTNPPVTYRQITQNNFGNNQIEESATRVNVTGENNVIKASTSKVNVVGENNTISEYTTYSSVVGQGNLLDIGVTNVNTFGDNHEVISGSANSVILGGGSNTINSSSLVAIVGGVSNVIKDSPTSRNVMLGGLNTTLSASQDTVVINGDGDTHTGFIGNTLIGDFQSGTTATTGSDYRFNNTLVNGLYLEEDYYTNRHSYKVRAYKNSTDFAYSGDGLYKYVYEVTYDTTPSGSGQGKIELPSIVSQDQIGRTILFKGDNTLSPISSIAIKSFGDTDPIEGGTEYIMKNPYGWVELRASQYSPGDGESFVTEWRVIRGSHGGEVTGNKGAYGSFYSTSDQALANISSSQAVTLNGTFASDRVYISGSSAIVFEYAGTYQLSYVVQVSSLSNARRYLFLD